MDIWTVLLCMFAIAAPFALVAIGRYFIALSKFKLEVDAPEEDVSAQEIKDRMKYAEQLRVLHSFNRKKKTDDDTEV
jgi:hypothetical protein